MISLIDFLQARWNIYERQQAILRALKLTEYEKL